MGLRVLGKLGVLCLGLGRIVIPLVARGVKASTLCMWEVLRNEWGPL